MSFALVFGCLVAILAYRVTTLSSSLGPPAVQRETFTHPPLSEPLHILATEAPSSPLPPPHVAPSQRALPLNTTLDFILSRKVLCWVPLRHANSEERKLISDSWGRDCDRLVFFAEKGDPPYVIAHNYSMVDQHDLWNLVHICWQYLYEHEPGYDYYVKLDADSFFIAPNLKKLVGHLNPAMPIYTGHVTWHKPGIHLVLGAAVVISKGTLQAVGPHLPFVRENNVTKCVAKSAWSEDWQFYKCLRMSHVENTTLAYDPRGRDAFLIRKIGEELSASRDSTWLWQGKPAYVQDRLGCCSVRLVGFHYLKTNHGLAYYFGWAHYFLRLVQVDPLKIEERFDEDGK